MILGGLIGYALQQWLQWQSAVPIGVLAGMVAAQFVPAKGGCGVQLRDPGRDSPPST